MGRDRKHAVTQRLTQWTQELPLVNVVADVVAEPQRSSPLLRKNRVKEPDNGRHNLYSFRTIIGYLIPRPMVT